jgi:MFS family permease
VYSFAPIWGRIVDSRGPRILLITSSALLLGGYSGITYLYDSGLQPHHDETNTLPTLSFYMLVFCSFLTGSGGCGGLTSSLNSTVKSFPDAAVSGYGPPPIVI